jgi:hypothetical protein
METHNQNRYILRDRRQHSIILDIRPSRGADCDSDYYLVMAKFRERLTVSKQTTQKYRMERFNLKKLKEVEGKKQHRVEISNRFAALKT